MARNWLLAHWRRIAMQAALCALLLVTVGLAALVTHEKRLALRLPLVRMPLVGRLEASLPRGWTPAAVVERIEGADWLGVDEPVPEPMSGRRITVMRVRCGDLMSPLEFLLRSSFLIQRDVTGKDPTNHDLPGEILSEPAKLQRLDVAGWPGVMVTRTVGHLGGRRAQEKLLACSVLPRGQAVVIKLEGAGAADAADEELLRQIAEATYIHDVSTQEKNALLLPEPAGAMVELGDGVLTAVPAHYVVLPNDDAKRTSRELISDGSDGHWTAIELIPCMWLGDEPPDEQLLTMLAARDHTWHSASVQKLGDTLLRADRVTLAGEMQFPVRAYCLTGGADQALLAIIRGGWRDDGAFDAAWAGVSGNVRFTPQHRDLSELLERGAAESKRFAAMGLNNLLPQRPYVRRWSLSDPANNAERRDWMSYVIGPSTTDGVAWSGSRLTIPTPWSTLANGLGEGLRQDWSGASDLSSYLVGTERNFSSNGETNQRGVTQRMEFRNGKLGNALASEDAKPVPPQYVPGGWLPMLLGKASDQPMILRTESFLACDGAVPPGLLTLYVKRVAGEGSNCVSVIVNGSGCVTRWWYDAAGNLQAIDFGSNLRAQSMEAKTDATRD